MSSATSIDGLDADRLSRSGVQNPTVGQPDPSTNSGSSRAGSRDDTLRPWHFFVLVSLVAATAAVVIARESRPEHLVLISLTIGAAGFAGATLFRTLAPLVSPDVSSRTDGLSESMRAVLEREKMLVLRSIKELEFDRAMGKVSTRDFEEMAARLRARAMSLIRQLDAAAGYRELIERELKARVDSPAFRSAYTRAKRTKAAPAVLPIATVQRCRCGAANDADAAFCKRCGEKLSAGTGA